MYRRKEFVIKHSPGRTARNVFVCVCSVYSRAPNRIECEFTSIVQRIRNSRAHYRMHECARVVCYVYSYLRAFASCVMQSMNGAIAFIHTGSSGFPSD